MLGVLIVLYLVSVGMYSAAVFAVSTNPGRFGLLRRIIAWANLVQGHGQNGIVHQRGPWACGAASLRMALLRLGENNAERYLASSLSSDSSLVNMAEIQSFSRSQGLDARGYRFPDFNRFVGCFQTLNGTGVLLLLVESPDRLLASPAGILMLPYYLLTMAGSVFGLASVPLQHWTVLDGVRDGRVYLSDPLLGRISLTAYRFRRLWTHNGIVVGHHGGATGGDRC